MGFYFQSRSNGADADAQGMDAQGLTYNPSLSVGDQAYGKPVPGANDPFAAAGAAAGGVLGGGKKGSKHHGQHSDPFENAGAVAGSHISGGSNDPFAAAGAATGGVLGDDGKKPGSHGSGNDSVWNDPSIAQQGPYWVAPGGASMGDPEDYFAQQPHGGKPQGFGGPDGGRPIHSDQQLTYHPGNQANDMNWQPGGHQSGGGKPQGFGGPDGGRHATDDPSELVVSHEPSSTGGVAAPPSHNGVFSNAQQEKEEKWRRRDQRIHDQLQAEGKLTGQMVPVNAHGQGIQYIDAAEAEYRQNAQAAREAKRHQQQIADLQAAAHFGTSPAPHVASSGPQHTTGSSGTDFNWHPQNPNGNSGGKPQGFGGPDGGRHAAGSADSGTPIPVRTGQHPVLTPATDTKGFYSPSPASVPVTYHPGQSTASWNSTPPSSGGVKPTFHNEGRHAPPASGAAPAAQFPMKDPAGTIHTTVSSSAQPQPAAPPSLTPAAGVKIAGQTTMSAVPAPALTPATSGPKISFENAGAAPAPEPIKASFPSTSSYSVSQPPKTFDPNGPNSIKPGWGSPAASAPPSDPVNIAWNFDMDIDTDPVGGHKKKKSKKSHSSGGSG